MPALYFDPEGYSISGPRLMGRNAAGHSFLRGFFRHNTANSIGAMVTQPAHGAAFAEFAHAEHVKKPIETFLSSNMEPISKHQTLYLPGPGLDQFARKRALGDSRSFSLCCITHTTLSARAMDAITGLLTSPVEPWDALICTSRAVHNMVSTLLETEWEYLQSRIGATRFVKPQLPIIPLGLNCDEFTRKAHRCAAVRQSFSVSDDDIVVLFVGRLSFHAKAHPASLYQVLERVSKKRKITLIECGWFANNSIEAAFANAAATLAPHVRRIVLDGRDPSAREQAWHAADIFMSLTDNLQETFGITPIEAMASGLPVIVSDWDGYRDTVRDGIDGFRIPTCMPRHAVGQSIVQHYALDRIDYDHYCGMTSHYISVDLKAAEQALEFLSSNPTRRLEIGQDAQRHARSRYDWSQIIRQYETLWSELSEIRQSGQSTLSNPTSYPWPARMNPFVAFASYPSFRLDTETLIQKSLEFETLDFNQFRQLSVFTISNRILPDPREVSDIISAIPTGSSISIAELSDVCQRSVDHIIPIIMFALKTGVLSVVADQFNRQDI